MMSLNHPDKLIARGATTVEIIEAQDLIQDLKNAYELLIKAKRVR